MIRKLTLFIIAAFFIFTFLLPCSVMAEQANLLLDQIDRLASLGKSADPSLGETIADGIERDPKGISTLLLAKLKDETLKEQQLAVYVWALGLTRDQSTVDTLIDLYRQSKSDWVRGNCLRAVTTIGGSKAGDFLLATLETTSDKGMRFNILNLLGQMQYETALPKSEEILREDPKKFYWQSIFVFGKMGDKAVPFLLKKINDENRNVRANTINVLGHWLIAPEAAQPLRDYYWTEKDLEIRGMILSSLERTITDLAVMKQFFLEVTTKEKDKKLVQFAHETLGNMGRLESYLSSFEREKQVSTTSFQREYASLYKSGGKEGNYKVLAVSSTVVDEPKLKALRERILQRDSDEAFYDYQKVNNIIMHNRWIKK